eukprot:m.64978 g.64978  ORF g.64978 m.64978 type:complete len:271 (+) comp13960_c0_seq1:145-957(+)
MDLPELSRRLAASDTVARKAAELLRLAKGNSSTAGAVCLPAACLELAAKVCGETLDSASAECCARLSGATKKVYQHTLLSIQVLLNLQTEMTVRRLALQVGYEEFAQLGEKFLDEFIASQPPAQQAAIRQQALYAAAALAIAIEQQQIHQQLRQPSVKAKKIKPNLALLSSPCSASTADVKKAKLLMERALKINQPKAAGQSQADAAADAGTAAAEEASGGAGKSDGKKTESAGSESNAKRKRPSYEDWKKAILQKTEGAATTDDSKAAS